VEVQRTSKMFKKIDLFVDGKYYCSTSRYRTLLQEKSSLEKAHFVAGGGGWKDGIESHRINASFSR